MVLNIAIEFSEFESRGEETISRMADPNRFGVGLWNLRFDSCITNPPRLWQEVPYLYSQPVSNVFSGGVAFSYFPTSECPLPRPQLPSQTAESGQEADVSPGLSISVAAGGDYGMVTFSGTNGQT